MKYHVCLCLLIFCVFACEAEKDGAPATPRVTAEDIALQWENYEVPRPDEALQEILYKAPTEYVERLCLPLEEDHPLYMTDSMTVTESGERQLCLWNHIAGSVPDGYKYTDFLNCDKAFTQGPSWFIQPKQVHVSDVELLNDPEFVRELNWVADQVKTSGCACCHSSQEFGYAVMWDIDAPGVWTDTFSTNSVAMSAGLSQGHERFGYFDPESNHGFDRSGTVISTTDTERMRAFFKAEFERRGGTQEDIEASTAESDRVTYQLSEESLPCQAGEGVAPDGKIYWNGENARQIYIQELNAENPGFPPNFDLPENTLWALYVDTSADALFSGTVTAGEVREGTRQMIPEAGQPLPPLEEGRQYRLFVTSDFVKPRMANCVFTFGEQPDPEAERTCEDPDSVCVKVKIPEDLSTTPDALLIGFYEQLPPSGPPSIFPPFRINQPDFEPGATLEFALNGSRRGEFTAFAVLYMPDGGLVSWRPLPGTDYVGQTEPLQLTGEPIKVEAPVVLTIAE